jgi:hypothetical protein
LVEIIDEGCTDIGEGDAWKMGDGQPLVLMPSDEVEYTDPVASNASLAAADVVCC